MQVLVIDSYDSFTFNLVQYLGELGARIDVRRNDRVTVEQIAAAAPDRIVLSPGPGRPEDAGVIVDVVRRLGARIPILGVCLGHQAIGHAFGGRVVRAPRPMHGKRSVIEHDGLGVFAGLAGPFEAARYHSLIVEEDRLSADLVVCARTAGDRLVMALRHREWPLHGVQFHPESVLTGPGRQMLRNFLDIRSGRISIPAIGADAGGGGK
jgi:anthranilate synthase/aminodeoxychorismate synthase-like glutamine amidotransferase